MAFWSFTKNPKIYVYKSSCIHNYDKIVTKYSLYKIQIPAYFIQNILSKLAQITWYIKYDKIVTKYLLYKIQIPAYFIKNILTKLAQITWYTKFINLANYFEILKI